MVVGRLSALFRSRFGAPLAPEAPICVVGDVHGCASLLDRLLAQLARELSERDGAFTRLVFAGDYVDRGEDTAGVLARLRTLRDGGWPGDVTFLKGNHESMLLTFLDDPVASGPDWVQSGGAYTLASFQLAPPPPSAPASTWVELRDALAAAIGSPTVEWIAALPTSWRTGNVFVAHAGADPERALEAQEEDVLLWGHEAFARVPRRDGNWVVHGHTIQPRVEARDGRIGVDTGAYATDRLSAVLIESGGFRVIST